MTDLDVLVSGYDLVEGPTVLADGSLAFSDVLGGGVHRLDGDGGVSTIVPKRRGVGGIAAHTDGGIVCTGREVIRVTDGQTTTLLAADGAAWNDLAVDASGRVWAGSVRFQVFDPQAEMVPGEVWRIDSVGDGTPIIEGVHHCNGIGFSPDGERVYVSDTRRGAVVSARTDGSDETHLALPYPDGLAVDAEGFLWVALYVDGKVVRADPDGAIQREIELGQPATSVCLTPDATLYITTGRGRGRSGAVLRTRVDTPAEPLPAATI